MPTWLTACCLVASAVAALYLLAAIVFPDRF
ncbi:hypothetical protein HNQ52_002086 [Chiayiivirga flava]|uniref:Potassium-transporting ATPase subunit F n=1 Tax=Chiayiivirga flava TaxID=659595 RepID=A0A7W8D5Y8_9GAMM|nr:potassium-transporting ATPase subunit F [Chiayiivirga flava]MBB5208544.1 hypothetical protein [Chiayiivirga flava]